jgi:hypothetical protein
MNEDKTNFVDAEAYGGYGSGNSSLTFPMIVLLQVQKCSALGSFDLKHGGYWNQKLFPDPKAGMYSVYDYIESRARSYEQAVLSLYDLLDGYSDGSLKSFYDEYVILRDKETEKITANYDEEKSNSKAYGQEISISRAECARSLFRYCVAWLRKNNYLQNDSVEEGLEE